MKKQYIKGGLGDSILKLLLNDVLQALLKPIREKRESISDDDIEKILIDGSLAARNVAQNTLREVKKAIGLGSNLNI